MSVVDQKPEVLGRGGQKTAEVISDAAFGLFVEDGYPRVTADAIAKRAGVSVRTFYRHFPEGKEGVVLRYARSQTGDFIDAVRSRPPAESAFEALRNAAVEMVAEWNSSTPGTPIVPLEVSAQVYAQIASQDAVLLARLSGQRVLSLEPIVQQLALRLGVDPDTDVTPRLMAHTVDAAVRAAWLTTRSDPESDWTDLVVSSLDLLEKGLAGQASLKGAVTRRRSGVATESA
jgi:AcrR family transcriptional regulator